jgi:hypothetical protein
VLRGEPGIGKTALLRTVVEQAQARFPGFPPALQRRGWYVAKRIDFPDLGDVAGDDQKARGFAM